MSTIMTEEIAKSFSKFTTDKDLTLDDFIVFQDIDIEHITMMNRYNTLLNKTYTTEAEKAEMTSLLTQLEEYMPTSNTWNRLCACIKTMQMFIRDGIVIFINEKQEEFKNILANYKYMGEWDSTIIYQVGNGVRRNGFGFLCISDNNLNHEPNAEIPSDSNWVRFTIKGDKGDPSLNISYKGEYNSTTTYNLSSGDAVTYNGVMYYAKADGIIGVLPTDQTKWAYAYNVIVKDTPPTDIHVIWWDTTQNKFKRYTSNLKWESQTVSANDITLIDLANYFTSSDMEGALQEIGLNINNINSKLSLLSEDNNKKPLWRGNKIGATNANEISISTISGLNATNVQDGLSQLFQYANSGKTSIASVIGNVTGSNTHSQIVNEIQYDKNILATNLTNKGISASGSSNLRDLASAITNITIQSMGGKKFASGVSPYVRTVTSITLDFTPYLILATTNYSSSRYCIYFPTLGLNHVFYSDGMLSSPTVYKINGTSFIVDNGVGGDTLYWYAFG